MSDKRLFTVSFVTAILLFSMVYIGATIPQQVQGAQFVIASWTYPFDEYGQGIYQFYILENSSGMFQYVYKTPPSAWLWNRSSSTFDVNATSGGTILQLLPVVLVNHTEYSFVDYDDAKANIRLNCTMRTGGTLVYTLNNITFASLEGVWSATLWYFRYNATLLYPLQWGNVYTVTTTFEVFH